MPALGLIPLLEIIGLGVSAGSAAYGGYESAQGSGGSSSLQQAATNTAQQQAAQQQQQAIKANISNAQEQTGGSLGNAGLTNLASLLAGYGGQAGGANPQATQPTQSTTPGLQDALTQLQSGSGTGAASTNFSGGGDQSAPQSGDLRFQLTNPFTA